MATAPPPKNRKTRHPDCLARAVLGMFYSVVADRRQPDYAVQFFLFFIGWSFRFFHKNTRGLFAAALLRYFHVSFSAKVYALGPHGDYIYNIYF